jgi:M6 family metalloprotease-like protein
VTIQGDVFGWYKLPYVREYYGRDCLAIDDAGCDGHDASWQIARDAVAAAGSAIDYSKYDYFVFVHSGFGQESSRFKDDVWSVTYLGGSDIEVHTAVKTITKYEIVPELEAQGAVAVGVYTHEFGHQLGLPDLYNTSNGQTILGPWSLMDKGLWNGQPPGSSPAHMEAWSMTKLGWISGSSLAVANAQVSSFTIQPIEVPTNGTHAVEIPISTNSPPTIYYLVEVRQKIGFDSALPTTGVLITYVDERFYPRVTPMDAHPTVAGLAGATWGVGQTFTDSKNSVAVTVSGISGNAYQVTVNRGAGPPPPQQNQTYVDLAVASINAQPPVITSPNTTVTITVQISNLGTQAVTNVPVEIDLDGRFYKNIQVSVSGGSTVQTSFTWISVLGSHTFRIVIDPNNTINDTNRANNVATFTLNVGPTLTINVPSNLTSAGSVWVSINGVKYNVTSSQFQASVPNGTITVQIQSGVNMSEGVRQGFSGWSDGVTANPRQITVTSNTALSATFKIQYLVKVISNSGTTTPSGWYDANSTVTISAASPSNVTERRSRLMFTYWSGGANSTAASVFVKVTKPVTLNANWKTQFYVDVITSTGVPSGVGWYDAGQTATISVQSPIQVQNGTRQVFIGWNGTAQGQGPQASFIVHSPNVVQANWKTQYLVQIQSSYGNPQGYGWYDAGSVARVSVQPEIDYTNQTRRMFDGWTGDYSGTNSTTTLQVNSPRVLVAKWTTQYQLTFRVSGVPNSTYVKLNISNVTYDVSVNNPYQNWFDRGRQISPATNQTIGNGVIFYKFAAWHNSTGGATNVPMTIDGPQVYTATYTNEFILPPIPGFPIESIIAGLLLGLLAIGLIRRKRNTTA